jgi:uncharacterized membrane protein YdjX (TVP38/TMEM64 family)
MEMDAVRRNAAKIARRPKFSWPARKNLHTAATKHPPMPNDTSLRRIAWALLGIAVAILVLWAHSGFPTFNMASLRARQVELMALHAAQPWLFTVGLFLLFTLLSALALPGCSVLALAAGMCLGWMPGTLLVALASTVGATLSFLTARHWWRDAVRRRWGHRLTAIEDGLARDGAYYLFSLRVAPVIPYALINPLMGLSAMPLRQFFLVSLFGMLAGSAAYVYAGTVLSEASSWQSLFTPGLMAALGVLALLPWAARWLLRMFRPTHAVVAR